jgi:hypothetical protein
MDYQQPNDAGCYNHLLYRFQNGLLNLRINCAGAG